MVHQERAAAPHDERRHIADSAACGRRAAGTVSRERRWQPSRSCDGRGPARRTASAAELKRSLGITNTDVGLLAAVASLVGALATIPIGMLTDRVNRTRPLAGSIALWSVAMIAAGASTSFSTAGAILLRGRRHYPRDVATAAASFQAPSAG